MSPACTAALPVGWTAPQLLIEELNSAPRRAAARESRVSELLAAAGCPRLIRQQIPRNQTANVICEIPGKTHAEILIAAHHDKLGPGKGIADNWTGITALVSLVLHYAQNKPNHTLRFAAFGLEEDDLRGASLYVREMKRGRVPRPSAMINIDTLGVTDLRIDRRSDKHLQCLTLAVAEGLELPAQTVRLDETVGDWQPFHRAGVPVLQFFSLSERTLSLLHTYRDNEKLVDPRRLQEAFQVIAATIAYLDDQARGTVEEVDH